MYNAEAFNKIKERCHDDNALPPRALDKKYDKKFLFIHDFKSGICEIHIIHTFQLGVGDLVVVKRILINNRSPTYGLLNNELNILKYLKNTGDCNKYTVCYRDDIVYDKSLYIVQEYTEGFITLGEAYEKPELNEKMYIIINNIAKGLNFLHNHNVCHNDIKPENILVNLETGNIKYIDFGASCLNECMINWAGTHYYKSPEMEAKLTPQIGKFQPPLELKDGKANDIWSLGITIYTLLYKQFPLQQLNRYEPETINAIVYDPEHDNINNVIRKILVPQKDRPDIKNVLRLLNLVESIAVLNKKKWFFGLF